jgi:hypothetical protein
MPHPLWIILGLAVCIYLMRQLPYGRRRRFRKAGIYDAVVLDLLTHQVYDCHSQKEARLQAAFWNSRDFKRRQQLKADAQLMRALIVVLIELKPLPWSCSTTAPGLVVAADATEVARVADVSDAEHLVKLAMATVDDQSPENPD